MPPMCLRAESPIRTVPLGKRDARRLPGHGGVDAAGGMPRCRGSRKGIVRLLCLRPISAISGPPRPAELMRTPSSIFCGHVLGGHAFEERDAGRLRRREDFVAGGRHVVRVRRIVRVRVAERHAHVARAPLGEGDARDRAEVSAYWSAWRFSIFRPSINSPRVERPRIGLRQILRHLEAPDRGGVRLAGTAALALAQARRQRRAVLNG